MLWVKYEIFQSPGRCSDPPLIITYMIDLEKHVTEAMQERWMEKSSYSYLADKAIGYRNTVDSKLVASININALTYFPL